MSQLVRLEGKHTTQTAHYAVSSTFLWLFSSCFPLKRLSISSAGWRANRTPPPLPALLPRRRHADPPFWTSALAGWGLHLCLQLLMWHVVVVGVDELGQFSSGPFHTFTTLQESYWPPSTDILQCLIPKRFASQQVGSESMMSSQLDCDISWGTK